jgi:alpha-tubulin suppressor-like RCC1 family protein
LTSNIVSITANWNAFAALKSDGTVYSWGNKYSGGGVSSHTMSSLRNVRSLTATHGAFAALRTDGSVFSWGEGHNEEYL